MENLTDTEIYSLHRQWYRATTGHDPDTQSTVLYSQFARFILNTVATNIHDSTKFGGTQ